jgi:hypothetical protein
MLACAAFLAAVCSCQRDDGLARLAVFGKVSSDSGDPVNGTISFLPDAGTEGPAAIASLVDGIFAFDSTNGPVAGRYRVVIVRQLADEGYKGASALQHDGSAAPEEWSYPAEVSPAEIEFDFRVPEASAANG